MRRVLLVVLLIGGLWASGARASVFLSDVGGAWVTARSMSCVDVGDALSRSGARTGGAGVEYRLSACVDPQGVRVHETSHGDTVYLWIFTSGVVSGSLALTVTVLDEVAPVLSRRVEAYPVGEVIVYVGCLILFALGLLIGS